MHYGLIELLIKTLWVCPHIKWFMERLVTYLLNQNIKLAIGLVKQSIAQGKFHNSYHHFSTLAIFTLLLLYLNSPQFIFTCSLLSCKPSLSHLQSTSSFILVLGKANDKRAQSCISGRQNLREYLFYLQLLVGFDTLTYQKRLQLIPYTCGLSRPFSGAIAGEQQRGVNILVCACLIYH